MVYEVRNQFTPTAVAVNVSNAMLPSLATTANVPSIAQFGAGASYNLGMVTPSVMYYNQKWNNPANAAAAGAITGTQLGAIVPVGKEVNIRASYTIGNVQNNGSNLYNTNAAQAMVDYSLSKRSRLYGIYGQTNWNSQRESYTASVKVQQYGLGLLHTF
jgi:predicted porin